jgi:hypothetical protein
MALRGRSNAPLPWSPEHDRSGLLDVTPSLGYRLSGGALFQGEIAFPYPTTLPMGERLQARGTRTYPVLLTP